ncbi:aminotransferase, classes I and II family protein [Trichomonas vaginalis G3]|uniref:Aminotransferase, classes I and II family protein n=1 Tax=Trichomonas vaginalis (strain ATCC PRA-98 / G3) TaxID=412133 RepID=A2GAH8_TRIV3|nr:alanine aminotransferase family [Trichomonas vaginalis G3]EAX85835.1 aminotransferase, classes I and II family protein [Trichomonas vaginalis G3]KAI5502724.1 alanine aminotransferase family [Trichomonas vaginalis G3]|eukprot:XP_001298765.1 aminotransferase, classes I and II family protein [Trichomonas vaginalis G3]
MSLQSKNVRSSSNSYNYGKLNSALSMATLNPQVIKAEYAVRGELAIRADILRKKLQSGEKLPFKNIISCNIGNPFVVGKKAITFPRQVISCIENPDLLNIKEIPEEARHRAAQVFKHFPAGLGAYTHSQGLDFVREHIAEYIKNRDDGIPAHPDKIFITTGASSAVTTILNMIIAKPNVGIMIPFPQYPLYTAEIALKNGRVVPYYLKESSRWSLDLEELNESYTVASKSGVDIKAIVVINPGNPTGSVLTAQQMRDVIEFCEQNNILLIADEVYQFNTYNPEKSFISFKKVASEMKSSVQLISLNSISKGFMGECGHRAGYMELYHIPDDVKAQFYKMASIQLCPNTVGQVILDIMCHPPESPECRKQWDHERDTELTNLKNKSQRLLNCINSLPGLESQPADGAMYLFPSIHLPLKALEAAKSFRVNGKHVSPDMFWSLQLLEQTGIAVVPGSGFGQVPGTHHFRTTFLPEAEQMDEMIERLTKFQNDFMNKYQ